MRRPPLPSRTVSHVPTYRTKRALVPTDARSRFNRYEPAMTIATAANAVTPPLKTVTPFPERVIIITMAVVNIAELDIHVAELSIDNAELAISVSEFAPNYPTVAGDNAKGSTSPAVAPTALLYLIIYIPFIKRVGWVVHCSLHGVIIGRESDTKSFVPFQGFALMRLRAVADIPESGLSDIRNHPPPRLPTARLKRNKIKKPPLAVKKVRLAPVQKVISLFSYRQVSIRWNNTSKCFFTANGGFFDRPTAAFFTVAAVVAMQRMALGMVVMTRRKTRFPTGVATVIKKAKPTTAVMAFCIYIILYYILLQVPPTANCNSYRVAVGCVPSTMYFGLKLHTENLIIIPHGMPWGIIVLILMTPALPCLLFPLIKFTNHGIKIHILRNFNPHFTEKCLFNVLLELPLWACHPRWICCMLPSSACRHRWISQLVCPW